MRKMVQFKDCGRNDISKIMTFYDLGKNCKQDRITSILKIKREDKNKRKNMRIEND